MSASFSVNLEEQIASLRLLVSRLERLSADSFWAHRASGLRGSLLRILDQVDSQGYAGWCSVQDPASLSRLAAMLTAGYAMLARAAREIRVPEDYLGKA